MDNANDNFLLILPIGCAIKELQLQYEQPCPKPNTRASIYPILITVDDKLDTPAELPDQNPYPITTLDLTPTPLPEPEDLTPTPTSKPDPLYQT